AGDQQRPVADRRDLRALVLLLRGAIEAAVLKGTARASLDDLRDCVWFRLVGNDPGPSLELEHAMVAAKALGNVDADVKVEGDLDVATAVDLAHHSTLRALVY